MIWDKVPLFHQDRGPHSSLLSTAQAKRDQRPQRLQAASRRPHSGPRCPETHGDLPGPVCVASRSEVTKMRDKGVKSHLCLGHYDKLPLTKCLSTTDTHLSSSGGWESEIRVPAQSGSGLQGADFSRPRVSAKE